MDHPGFVIRKRLSQNRWLGEFLGSVPDSYFEPGVKLRLMPGRAQAVLGKCASKTKRRFEIQSHDPASEPPEFAVWDLPEFKEKNGIIHGRVCDDLIGVAGLVAVLIGLKRARAAAYVIGAVSRAEEVGFHGALALAESKRLPPDSLVVSLETSRELPPVKMGDGVIIRVGDRASIFSAPATRFLAEVAGELSKRETGFKYQRALMGGGTCEATAYQERGYECAAVCVALGNYHNCARGEKIGAEFVSVADGISMAELLFECAREMRNFTSYVKRLPRRLDDLTKTALRELQRRQLRISERTGEG
jgi:endoglucanase